MTGAYRDALTVQNLGNIMRVYTLQHKCGYSPLEFSRRTDYAQAVYFGQGL